MNGTAAASALVGCDVCSRVYPRIDVPAGCEARCPVCTARLHGRKPHSLGRTWALVIAALIMYVPANTFPIMSVVLSGQGRPDTILSGIESLFAADEWVLAVLVFFASITVPVLKLLGLTYLMLSVQLGWRWRPRDRTILYRIIENIGRWSMIDIFMLSILVALVKLGAVATIEPGVGATSFAAVVVLTMFAAASFDPRLIWDALEDTND
jgi:paraquat-inducible protein A